VLRNWKKVIYLISTTNLDLLHKIDTNLSEDEIMDSLKSYVGYATDIAQTFMD
jgi:hypothetical protein